MVGAGAVGVSYGFALAKGGASLTFFVKKKYVETLTGGIPVYLLKNRKERVATLLDGYGLVSSADEVAAAGPFDQVWLGVSSPALRGPWLGEVLAAAGPTATVVVLQPGSEDLGLVQALVDPGRVVSGMITLVAYQSPLPGEAPHPEGIAIWMPPLASLPILGPREAAKAVVAAIKQGGWRAAWKGERITPGGAMASGVLLPAVAAMEGAGWTIAGLKTDGWGELAAASAKEAMGVIASFRGKKPPLLRKLVFNWAIRTFLKLARWKAPFDFEVYFEKHFTKVRDQTEEALSGWIAAAEGAGLPSVAMTELRRRVFEAA